MEVHKNWKSRLYNSLERCQIIILDKSIEIKSSISGLYEDKTYSVTYSIETNENWETLFFKITSLINGNIKTISYSSDGNGNWFHNGKHTGIFSNCIDIDISLTPLTNTLPIKRIGLAANEEIIIDVLYIDVLGETEKHVSQKYKRLSSMKYKYENIPNDFAAVITVSKDGFVVDYPNLFESI